MATILLLMGLSGCGERPQEPKPELEVCAQFHFKLSNVSELKTARQMMHSLSIDLDKEFTDEDPRWGVRSVMRESEFAPIKFLLTSRKGPYDDKRDMLLMHFGVVVKQKDGSLHSSCGLEKNKAEFERILKTFDERWKLSPGPIPIISVNGSRKGD